MLLLSRHCLTQEEFPRLSNADYDHCGINLHQASNLEASIPLGKLESING